MDKTYNPAATEQKHYPRWEKSGAFASDVRSNKKPYAILMPPPNVTGSLHMGHALTFTLQDVLIRYQRMHGLDALWQPGTDHASIAVHTILERQLHEKGTTRRELGREKFLEMAWEWKKQSGSTIMKQLRRLGASANWARERFTMDTASNRAVAHAFVELYRKKLIYKDKRLVNWDPKLLTVVSDLEVEQREMKGHLWHLRYPLADEPSKHIVVATTRPETMLGDSAVAVHPDDERYKALAGKMVRLPLTGRLVPIIADKYADPEKGSGAVKITPAHDFNDFEVWQRHRSKDYFKKQPEGGLINIFERTAKLNDTVPAAYRGLDRFEARRRVLEDLEAQELVEKTENVTHMVPHGDRSGVALEPYLTEQWYCDAKTLAQPAIEAVESGKTQFVPKNWENTYFDWMRNIQPWCISRQLWWGHQIPAWYGPNGKIFVAESEEEARAEADKIYKGKTELKRDEDVLDTWFSSALWPFSTLGWPDKTPELSRYYPTDVLVTGFDIIFFWVARMMMMGLHFMGDVPFRKVYIHALVRDEKGQKMSKTKGNVIDPLEMFDQYGTDALRFTLTSLSTPGRDIRLSPGRIESGRNFATKLWNAARFCEMNECKWQKNFKPASVKQTVNKWILGELAEAIGKTTQALDIYRFDETASTLYHFIRDIFCDWYLEFAKPLFQGTDEAAKAETRATTAYVLDAILHLLHPLMPYITEEIWQSTRGDIAQLMKAAWPEAEASWTDKKAMEAIRWVIDAITLIRSVRSELNVPAAAKIQLIVNGAGDEEKRRLETYRDFFARLARLAEVKCDASMPKGAAQAVLGKTTFVLPLADVIDLEAERARLEKERAKIADEIVKLDQKLKNPQFTDKAPAEVVDEHKERLAAARATLATLDAARSRLSA